MKPIDWEGLLKMVVVAGTIIGGLWAWFSNHSSSKKECEKLKSDLADLESKYKDMQDEVKINRRKINKIIERLIEKSSF